MSTRKHHSKQTPWFIGSIAIILLAACSAQKPAPQEATEPFNFKRLLLVPMVDMARVYGENVTVQCRLSGNIVTTGQVREGAAEILTDRLETLLKQKKDFELIPVSQAVGALSDILSGEKTELPERELLVKVGRTLDADAIMAGKVYRFVERDGSNYSVKLPASVGFDVNLIRVLDSRIMWTGHYDETQQSLFENIYRWNTFLKRGGRWITAEEMAFDGLDHILKKFPTP
jgi:hypothetical protein